MRLVKDAQDDRIRGFSEITSYPGVSGRLIPEGLTLGNKGPNLKDSCVRSYQRNWHIVSLLGQPEGSSRAPDCFYPR